MKQVKTLQIELLRVEAHEILHWAGKTKLVINEFGELEQDTGGVVEKLGKRYNEFVGKFNQEIVKYGILAPLKKIKESDISYVKYYSQARTIIREIMIECKKAIKICDTIVPPEKIQLSYEKSEELRTLKKEVGDVIDSELPLSAKDLSNAIQEFEAGHLLPSILICGRVIDVILDLLAKYFKIDKSKEGWVKSTLERLTKEKVLERGAEDKIIGAIKKWRNEYSHNIGYYPADPEDCLIVIAGTSKLLKSLVRSKLHKEINLK